MTTQPKFTSALDQLPKVLAKPTRHDVRTLGVEGFLPMEGKILPLTSTLARAEKNGLVTLSKPIDPAEEMPVPKGKDTEKPERTAKSNPFIKSE